MVVRLVSLVCFFLTATSCAHFQRLTPQQQAASNISSSFVRLHTQSTYEIYRCETGTPVPTTKDCHPLGIQITTNTGMASGGVVKHYDDYTVILTAQHVTSGFNARPRAHIGLVRAFSEIIGEPHNYRSILKLFQNGSLVARGISSRIRAFASNDQDYLVDGIKCHPTLDMCFIRTEGRIEGVEPLEISEDSPVIGDEVLCAQGPFGYAIPGMMVPIFRGTYSGSTPRTGPDEPRDYYTFPVSPGSSGSLITTLGGQIIGIVTAFMHGPICANDAPCQLMSSGITTSVPHSEIVAFFNTLLIANQTHQEKK